MNSRWATTFTLLCTLALPNAQAGIIEDLLAKPAIQALLGRQQDLQSALKNCADAKYQQRNAKLCQEAADAARVARMPPELRTLVATPHGSASIRELCLAAQGSPAQATYLCVELGKADPVFNAALEQQRAVAQQRAAGASAEQSR